MNLNPVKGNMYDDDDKCGYHSNEYCVYELSWWYNDDHYHIKHRFPDADLRLCKTPCPYLEADGTLRHYPDMPEPEEELEDKDGNV